MKSRLLAVATVLAAIAVVVLVARSADSVMKSDLRAEPAATAWPADRTWSWLFNLPSDLFENTGIVLRFRVASSQLGPGESPVLSPHLSAMAPADAQHEFGTSTLNFDEQPPRTGTVTVQLVDLSELGAESVRPGQDLRVLADLAFGESATALAGDDRFLPAGRFVGHSIQSDGSWTNGELYLMSFYVQDDRTLSRYDVLLEQQ